MLNTLLLVCPFVFGAGFVDAIAGGGGLISLPIYMIAGLQAHQAVATNKMSSSCGTALATYRFYKNGFLEIKKAIWPMAAAILGSLLGARLSLLASPKVLNALMVVVMPVAAFCIFNKSIFRDHAWHRITKKRLRIMSLCSFIVGIYDGFYGPGTGTFLLLAFTIFARLGIARANAFVKMINLSTNVAALSVFLMQGKVIITVGLLAALCNMAGNYLGSGLVMDKGAKVVKPMMAVVLVLLLGKVIHIY
jgi:uncharacterized membrane protein YfcA